MGLWIGSVWADVDEVNGKSNRRNTSNARIIQSFHFSDKLRQVLSG
jgi:hypothetical protein